MACISIPQSIRFSRHSLLLVSGLPRIIEHIPGSHEIWRNPETKKQAPIPYHRTKDIGPALLARILRELEIERNDFDQA